MSGSKFANRPEILKLIKRIQSKNNDICKVYSFKLDRISRSTHEIHWFIKLCQNHGVDYIALKDGIDTSNPVIGKILVSVFGLVSNLELENIRIRATESIKKRNKEGRIFTGRYVSIGYQLIKDEKGKPFYKINENEAEIVRYIFDSYISGLSITDIARRLNDLSYRTRTNQPFIENSVERILKNPIYIGKVKPVRSNLIHGNFKETDLIKGLHDAIIPIDIWNQVQERFEKNKIEKVEHQDYLFSGKLICYKCGAKMYGDWSGSKFRKIKYYSCHNNHRVNACDAPAIRVDVIDKMIIDSLILLINSVRFKEFLHSNLIKVISESRIQSIDFNSLEDELQILEKRKQHFITQFKIGTIDKEQYDIGLKIINDKIKIINDQVLCVDFNTLKLDQETESKILIDVNMFIKNLTTILTNHQYDVKLKCEIFNDFIDSIRYIVSEVEELKFGLRVSSNLFRSLLNESCSSTYEGVLFSLIFNK